MLRWTFVSSFVLCSSLSGDPIQWRIEDGGNGSIVEYDSCGVDPDTPGRLVLESPLPVRLAGTAAAAIGHDIDLFGAMGEAPLPPPYKECGPDPTQPSLGCEEHKGR
jgi:hypothetical protein